MWRRKQSALPAFADGSRPARRQVPLWLYMLSLVVFVLVALGLGVGLWLACARYDDRVGISSSSSIKSNNRLDISSIFNSSSYYGIPTQLDVVPADRLVNATELDLQTGFSKAAAAAPPQSSPSLYTTGTGVVREYTFNISQALAAPDGFQKPMILVNGQSPGPLIEAFIGDTVHVHVHNAMGNWSATLHWHGIDQHGSPWMDGVAGVSQCGIPPGESFTYEFVVDGQRGTYWWHSHLSIEYTDGVYGPIVIHDPDEMVPKVDDEKIVFMSDFYHTFGSLLLTSYLNPSSKWDPNEPGVEPVPDNILMNGRHTYNCSVTSTTYPSTPDQPFPSNCTGGELYKTKVTPGHTVRLRLINASSFFSYWFNIDNHTVAIVELDGVEIEPIAARGVYVNIGQRVSVIVVANQTAGNYYMRASLPQTCFQPYSTYTNAALEDVGYAARGVLSYEGVDLDAEPVGVAGNVSNPYGVLNNGARGDVWEGCDDMPFDMPKPMRSEDAIEVSDANLHYIEYVFRQAQDVNRIFINKTSWAPEPDNATLWQALDQQFTPAKANDYNSWSFPISQQVLLIPDANKGVQVVINSIDAMEHPWHLHGHTFQIVGWGLGPYGASPHATTWNLQNPMRRDTVTVPANYHVVLRFSADNPGLWAMHCHVAWHMEGGMFVSFVERPDDLVTLVNNMDPETRKRSLGFCGMSDDQAFGTLLLLIADLEQAEYEPDT